MAELKADIGALVVQNNDLQKALGGFSEQLKASDEEALQEKAKWGKTLTDLAARQEGLDKRLSSTYTDVRTEIPEELKEMKKTLAALAITVTALSGSVTALAKQPDEEPFRMDGVLFSGCKAAEPYALDADGSWKTIYQERCVQQKQRTMRPDKTPRRAPTLVEYFSWKCSPRGVCGWVKDDR